MSPRDALHRLIDHLPEGELPRAERVLKALKETAEAPSSYTLENAPIHDELETPEEAAAVAEAWREHREGKSLTTEELKREIGQERLPAAVLTKKRSQSTTTVRTVNRRAARGRGRTSRE